MEDLSAVAHLCPKLTKLVEFKDNFTNRYIYDDIIRMAPRDYTTLNRCFWNRQLIVPCPYKRTFTEDGYCYTFNALNSHDTYTNEYVFRLFSFST